MSLLIKDKDKILIVAPHADDESIGCGGLMALYGHQCDILLLTDGRKGYDSRIESVDEDVLVQLREEELQRAADMSGIIRVFKLRIPDSTVDKHTAAVMEFDITCYDHIFVPNRYERHKDHNVVPQLFLKMKKQQKARALLYEYEVWSPMPNPVFALDISSVFDKKIKMVSQYNSQLRFKDYVRMTRALNEYRGVGFNMKYAEVYAPLVSTSILWQIYSKIPVQIRRFFRRMIGKK